VLALVQGDQARTTSLMEVLLPLSRAQGDPLRTGRALTLLGMTAVQRGAHVEAARYLEESLSIARAQRSRFDLAQARYNLGLARAEAGRYAEANALIEDAHRMFDGLGHTFWRMNAVGALGYICLQQTDFGRAHALLVDYAALARQLQDKANSAAALEGLAVLASVGGRSLQAARIFAAAHRLREEIGGRLMSLRNRTLIEHAAGTARAQLGEDTWDSAWEAGQAMTADQAIAIALEGARTSGDVPVDDAGPGEPRGI